MKTKVFQGIEFVVTANFFASVMFLVVGSFLSLFDQYSLFDFNQDLYGELVGHLKVTMFYFVITEMVICAYCLITKKNQAFALSGFFMILMIGSTYFYGQINDMEIDEDLFLFYFYTGVSHILFSMMSDLKKTALN